MSPRNFFDTSDVKFLKCRKIRPSGSVLGPIYLPISTYQLSAVSAARLACDNRWDSNSNKLEQTRTRQKTDGKSPKRYELRGMVEVDQT